MYCKQCGKLTEREYCLECTCQSAFKNWDATKLLTPTQLLALAEYAAKNPFKWAIEAPESLRTHVEGKYSKEIAYIREKLGIDTFKPLEEVVGLPVKRYRNEFGEPTCFITHDKRCRFLAPSHVLSSNDGTGYLFYDCTLYAHGIDIIKDREGRGKPCKGCELWRE